VVNGSLIAAFTGRVCQAGRQAATITIAAARTRSADMSRASMSAPSSPQRRPSMNITSVLAPEPFHAGKRQRPPD
jgi:hypothetical protein